MFKLIVKRSRPITLVGETEPQIEVTFELVDKEDAEKVETKIITFPADTTEAAIRKELKKHLDVRNSEEAVKAESVKKDRDNTKMEKTIRSIQGVTIQ